MITTFSDVKASRIPEALNIVPTDSRLPQYVNEATLRLLKRGNWWGTVPRYQLSATSGIITFPKQIAAIETVALCDMPIPVHDFWFEYLDGGYGLRKENEGLCEANYVGHYPIFSDIIRTEKKVRVVCH